MTQPSAPLPTSNQPHATEDPKATAALAEIQSILSGDIDAGNLAPNVIDLGQLATGLLPKLMGSDPSFGHQISIGTATATFASSVACNWQAAHGLGGTPQIVIAVITDNWQDFAVRFTAWDGTNASGTIGSIGFNFVAGNNVGVSWIAIR